MSDMTTTRRLCGFRPSGRLHLGHYFAVVRPAIDTGADVLVADHHAPDGAGTDAAIRTLTTFGVPAANVVRQREVFDAELYFRLMHLATAGDLGRMTQYQSAGEGDRTGHLLTYPVLMAHDVAGYHEVLVGDDQEQHLRFARKLLANCNAVHGTTYPLPVARTVGGRVRDLRDPSKKMSKSAPAGCLFLDDKPETIRKKVRKASVTPDGLANLRALHAEFVGGEPPAGNEALKTALSDGLIRAFARPTAE